MRPTKAQLMVVDGERIGERYPIDRGTHAIGRSAECEIRTPDESVSDVHARISRVGAHWRIRDLGSEWGTYVNGDLIDECTLIDGDVIRVGRTALRVLAGEDLEHSYRDELFRLVTIDGLTQLPNRRCCVQSLEHALKQPGGRRPPLSLALIDIDHLRAVNETHGALAGDSVLAKVAKTINTNVRPRDLLARYSGEEFALVLPDTVPSTAARLAEVLRRAVEATICHVRQAQIAVTVSIGVCTAGPGAGDVADLLARAETMLYEAKRAGRNCVRSQDVV